MQQPPRVAVAQVDLLQVLVEPPFGEEVALRGDVLRQQRHLRQLGRACRQHLGSAQSFVLAEQPAHVRGHRVRRRQLRVEHVPVEVGRPAHGLAGVVDDEVEPVPRREQVRAERLDARRVAQVEPEDLEPVAPVVEVRLARVPGRGVAREARRDDQLRAGAQQLDPRLVADLHAAAGEQRDAAAQVGGLGALAEVEVAARQAELVVERVQLDVVLLADVAVLRLDRLPELGVVLDVDLLEPGRREDVGRGVDRLLAQNADAGLGEHRLVAVEPGRLLLAPDDLVEPPSLDDVGVVHVPGRGEQPRPLLERQRLEQAPVADDRLEEVGGGLQLLGDVVLRARRWPSPEGSGSEEGPQRAGAPPMTLRESYRDLAGARRLFAAGFFEDDAFDDRPEPFATSPVGSFGRPACLRSFAAISAISSGA